MDEKSKQQVSSSKDVEEIKDSLDEISSINDLFEQEYALIQAAKKFGLALEEYRSMFQVYLHQKKALWLKNPLVRPIILLEKPVERVTYWLERWDLLKLLDYASKITIIWGLIVFVNQRFQAEEQVRIEKIKQQYEAWQVITSATGQSGSGGRIDALQSLNENGISLSKLSVEGATLTGIDLKNAELQESNFRDSNLAKANLSYSNLQGADLSQTNLEEASLFRANLRGANLTGANLSTANFQEAFYDETTRLDAPDLLKIAGGLSLSSLARADLQNETRLKGAPLEGVDLGGANLQGADLQGANLRRSNLTNANLQRANLQGANFSLARLQGSDLRGSTSNTVIIDLFFIYSNSTKFPDSFDTSKGINLNAPIVEGGTFTWNEALKGGTRVPTSPIIISNIKNLATQLEKAQEKIGSPFVITSWYRPVDINRRVGGSRDSANIQGAQVHFYVEGYTCLQVIEQLSNWTGSKNCLEYTKDIVSVNILEPFPKN
ncbi:MAG: hypothetical protein F6K58_19770 [Symploca sp. SIO2E9]|nr:hypothetical protein [Symploca sp. SIO2E9]